MKHPRAGKPQESNGSGIGVMIDPRVRLFEGSNALKSEQYCYAGGMRCAKGHESNRLREQHGSSKGEKL